jgi:aerobic carbon-monoxide dehydrogenase medium subunit
MKSPAFSYARPSSLGEALQLLAQYGDGARLLAGGQTLLATLNMRLSEPDVLIDLQAIDSLKGISVNGNLLRIGAMATHSEIEASPLIAQHAPLLAEAVPHIAHRAIRNLGTFGGSIAYGDPAAEWPACLVALGGTVVVQSTEGERRIAADDFYLDLYTTALAEGEIITACEIPLVSNQKTSFTELARRMGDYAVVGLALTAIEVQGTLSDVRVVWLGLGSTPLRSKGCEAALTGHPLSIDLITSAVEVLRGELVPFADLTHNEATKTQLAAVLLKRALLTWSSKK